MEDASMEGLALAAWRGLMRAHATVAHELEAELERAHSMPLRSFTVLVELDQAPGRRMRMNELADSVGLSRSGLSRLVDRLDRAGLIVREDCEHDARGSFAVLTDSGARRVERARVDHNNAVRRQFGELFDARELEALVGSLERLSSR